MQLYKIYTWAYNTYIFPKGGFTMVKDKQLVFKLYEHEHEQIQEYAKGQGKTITGFIMDLIREEIENIEDEKDVRAVLNSSEPSISWAELRKEMGQ
jgi:predicted DNA-binding protein